MTPNELREWLGLLDINSLSDDVYESMKHLPVPQTDSEQIDTFNAYLRARKDLV